MKKLAIVAGVLLLSWACFQVPALAQNSSLWKFVGNLRPVVNSWRVDAPGGLSGSTAITASHLRNCDTIDTDANGLFVCGSDTGGAGTAWSSTGSLFAAFMNIFVNQAGDTMTGALTIQNGNTHTPTDTALLNIRGIMSGAALKITNNAAISGSLSLENSSTVSGGALRGFGLNTDCDTAGTSKLLWDATLGRFSCGTDTDTDTNTTYTAGQGLTLTSTAFSLTPSHSGTTIWATTALRSSGTLVWEGAGSGDSLKIQKTLSVSGALAVEGAVNVGGTVTATDLTCTDCLAAGDLGANSVDASELAATTVTLGTYGSALIVPVLTVDADGRLTSVTNTTFAGITGTHVTDDTFDFVDFQDTLDLDANLIVNSAGFTSIWNDDGNAAGDFTIEGDADTALFVSDASADRIGIGIAAPKSKLSVLGTISGALLFVQSGSNVINGRLGINKTTPRTAVEVLGTISGSLIRQNGVGDNFFGGNVGIGFSTTKARLAVNGTVSGALLFVQSGSNIINGRLGINKSAPRTALEAIGTISGSTLRGTTLSGTILRGVTDAKYVEVFVVGSGSTVATGSGKNFFFVPPVLSGSYIKSAYASVVTAGTTNTTSIQVRDLAKGSRKLFSTVISIDSAEQTSLTAATPAVINTTNRDVSGGSILAFDIPSVSTTAPKVLGIVLEFYKP